MSTPEVVSRETQLAEALGIAEGDLEQFREAFVDLEMELGDPGWQRLGMEFEMEFSRAGLRQIVKLCRIMATKNPLVGHAVEVAADYVFGQGVNIRARDTELNEKVVQPFITNRRNRAELFSLEAQVLNHAALLTDADLFFTLWDLQGAVEVRSIIADEIDEVFTNPDDRLDPWFYKRSWTQVVVIPGINQTRNQARTAWYVDWQYSGAPPSKFKGHEVIADCRVYHVRAGGSKFGHFGVPKVYAAIDWAQAYSKSLDDWARLFRSLSKLAWKATVKGGKRGVAASKAKIDSGVTTTAGVTNPAPITGSTFIAAEGGTDMTAIPKSGALVSASDARLLRLMVASAMAIPDTILSNDPQQGALATAKSLDRPTELGFTRWQNLHADILKDITTWAVERAAQAGKVKGRLVKDDWGNTTLELQGIVDDKPRDATVEVIFPPILERDLESYVRAVVGAATFGGKSPSANMPLRTLVGLLLNAFGISDIDELLEGLFPEGEQPPEEDKPEPGPIPEGLEPDVPNPEETPEEEETTPTPPPKRGRSVREAKMPADRHKLLDAEADTISAVMRTHFGAQRASVTARLGRGDQDWWSGQDWNAQLTEALAPALEAAHARFAQRASAQFGGKVQVTTSLAWAYQRAAAVAGSINQTTRERLAKALEAARATEVTEAAGGNQPKIEQLVVEAADAYFGDMELERANTIGLTEAAGAAHAGELTGARASGASVAYFRLSADHTTADECDALATGEPVDINDIGIADLPIHPNCRCWWEFTTLPAEPPAPAPLPEPVVPEATLRGKEAEKVLAKHSDGYKLSDVDRKLIEDYTAADYEQMNGALRGKAALGRLADRGVTFTPAELKTAKAQSSKLRQILARPENRLPERVETYRGLKGGRTLVERFMAGDIAPGSTIDNLDPGFMSTSVSEKIIKEFTGDVRMKITAPKGSRAMYLENLSDAAGEKELLLDAGTKFRVLGSTTRKRKGLPDMLELDLEVVV